jgi:hypothetical protein
VSDEVKWLGDKLDLAGMIEALKKHGLADPRKLRLSACAWGRMMWKGYGHETHQRLVERAEEYADGLITPQALSRAVKAAAKYRDEWETIGGGHHVGPSHVAFATAREDPAEAAWDAYDATLDVHGYLRGPPVSSPDSDEDLRLMRELFGNPFRPKTLETAWLAHGEGAAGKLARAAYDERILPQGTLDPQRLAVLADALEDGGCDDGEILQHLREPGPHYRGCWAVDLILAQTGGFAAPAKRRKRPE